MSSQTTSATTKCSEAPDAASVPPGGSTAGDGAYFQEWAADYRSIDEIAGEHGVTLHEVYTGVRREEERLRQRLSDDVAALPLRQSAALQQAAAQTLRLWAETSETKFLAEARRLLADIRKIWGLDKPPPAKSRSPHDQELERVAGVSRAEALRAQAAHLLQVAGDLQE